jgi:hypothetical protein
VADDNATIVSRGFILSQEDRVIEAVVVPEWGNATCYIREMAGVERDEFENYWTRRKALAVKAGEEAPLPDNFRAVVCVFCMCDSKGERLFSIGDALLLGAKSAGALDRIAQAAIKLNKLSPAEVKELQKNS